MNVCNQLYARWQAKRSRSHFIAVADVNLFEEAFRYHEARFALVWRVLPDPFWESIVKSMTKQFRNYLYLRTFWEREQDSFSEDFNAFIRATVLPQCPPLHDVRPATSA